MKHFSPFLFQLLSPARLVCKNKEAKTESIPSADELIRGTSLESLKMTQGEIDSAFSRAAEAVIQADEAAAEHEEAAGDDEASDVEAEKKTEEDQKQNPEEKEEEPEIELSDNLSEGERQMRQQILDKIKKQHEDPDRKTYNIILKGEWVEANLANRLRKQQEIWDEQDDVKNEVNYGVSDLTHFRYQEKHAEEKKLERGKKKEERHQDGRNFRQGERQRQKDEAELWLIQSAWEFKNPFASVGEKIKANKEVKETSKNQKKEGELEKNSDSPKDSNSNSTNEARSEIESEEVTEKSGLALAANPEGNESEGNLPEAAYHFKAVWAVRLNPDQWPADKADGHRNDLDSLSAQIKENRETPQNLLAGKTELVMGLQLLLHEKNSAIKMTGTMDEITLKTLGYSVLEAKNWLVEKNIKNNKEEMALKIETQEAVINSENFQKILSNPTEGAEIMTQVFGFMKDPDSIPKGQNLINTYRALAELPLDRKAGGFFQGRAKIAEGAIVKFWVENVFGQSVENLNSEQSGNIVKAQQMAIFKALNIDLPADGHFGPQSAVAAIYHADGLFGGGNLSDAVHFKKFGYQGPETVYSPQEEMLQIAGNQEKVIKPNDPNWAIIHEKGDAFVLAAIVKNNSNEVMEAAA